MDPNAPIGQYAIDQVLQGSNEIKQFCRDDAHLWKSKTRGVRYAFNQAASFAAMPRLDIRSCREAAELLFRELKEIRKRILNTEAFDPALRCVDMSTQSERVCSVLLHVGALDDPDDPERQFCKIEDGLIDLRAALKTAALEIEKFTSSTFIPKFRIPRNSDPTTSIFIGQLALDQRLWPFVPVTSSTFGGFVDLLDAGWGDVGLPEFPRGHRKKTTAGPAEMSNKSYRSRRAWLADRARHQLGF